MIRHAAPGDHVAIAELVEAAFGQPDEALLVARLRADGDTLFELVAEQAGDLIGHVLFSRLWADRDALFAALAPLAVRPPQQRAGVGTALVLAGLETARAFGVHGILVLGHPEYYPRFRFSPAAAARVTCPYSGSPALMALALAAGAFDAPMRIAYPSAFDG